MQRVGTAWLIAVALFTSVAATGSALAANMYYANVASNGAAGTGLGFLSSSRPEPAKYEVVFARSLSGCAYSVVIRGDGPGQAGVKLKTGTADTVEVLTYNGTGAPANQAFNLIVLCNE